MRPRERASWQVKRAELKRRSGEVRIARSWTRRVESRVREFQSLLIRFCDRKLNEIWNLFDWEFQPRTGSVQRSKGQIRELRFATG